MGRGNKDGEMRDRYSLGRVMGTIRDMGSGGCIHMDRYIGDMILTITKEDSYDELKDLIIMDMEGSDVCNRVTVDFSVDGVRFARAEHIRVDRLEDVLNGIRGAFVQDIRDASMQDRPPVPFEKIVSDYLDGMNEHMRPDTKKSIDVPER